MVYAMPRESNEGIVGETSDGGGRGAEGHPALGTLRLGALCKTYPAPQLANFCVPFDNR